MPASQTAGVPISDQGDADRSGVRRAGSQGGVQGGVRRAGSDPDWSGASAWTNGSRVARGVRPVRKKCANFANFQCAARMASGGSLPSGLMPRRGRLDAPGLISHVTARGVNGCPVYRSTRDRLDYLALLGEVVERFHWLLYAYCLMGNHVHLLVETTWPTLSAGVQRLHGIYGQRFNRRHGRYGHLYQGRFKSEPVQRDAHLLLAARYVVLNPVAVALCRHPATGRGAATAPRPDKGNPPSSRSTGCSPSSAGTRKRRGSGTASSWKRAWSAPALATDPGDARSPSAAPRSCPRRSPGSSGRGTAARSGIPPCTRSHRGSGVTS